MQTSRQKNTTSNAIGAQDLMMRMDEAAAFVGLSKSTLYKKCMRREIPYYKPFGKILFFNREELTRWLQRGRVATEEETESAAILYCHSNNA